MKRITLITIVISCFIFTAITIHASCHDDATCEKVELRLLRSLRWHENYSNRVDYYINDLDPSGMPSLTTDVNAAGITWKLVQFEGDTVQFNIRYLGSTFLHPAQNELPDNHNVMGWKGLGTGGDSPIARTFTWWAEHDPSRIVEADIGFNYYKPLNTHQNASSTQYCIRDTASHEWGHLAGLDHITRDDANEDNCEAHYQYYTMYSRVWKGYHLKESLECEDKWAHHKNYEEDE